MFISSIRWAVTKSLPTRLFVFPWTAAYQASLSFTISQSLLKIMSTESVILSYHHILCHPLPLFSPLKLSQYQDFFQWVCSSNQVAKVLDLQLQNKSFSMNIQGWFPLGLMDLISLLSEGLLVLFSNTTVQKHQFFSIQLSSQFNSHFHTWPLEKP